MLEKILQKLMEQREENSNVSDRTLQDMAKNLEGLITTDDQVEAMDFKVLIASIHGNVQKNTADEIKKLNAIEKKKTPKVEKTPEEILAEKAEKEKLEKQQAEIPPWAKASMEAIQKLSGKLDKFEADKTSSSREVILKNSLKDLPDYYANMIVAGFKNASFESEETFEEYLTQVKTNGDKFIQTAKEQGLNTAKPNVDVKKPELETGQTTELKDASEMVKKQKDDEKKNE